MELISAASVEHMVQSYGLWVLFVVLTLESMGVPAPGETALVTAALYAASTHQIGIVAVVLTATAAAVTGDNIGYLIGRSVGAALIARYGRYIGLGEARLKVGQYLFQRHGGKIVFFGRFVAFLRTFAALLAGMNHMRWPRFLVMNALGGLCWATLFGTGAYLFGVEMKRLAGPIGVVLLIAALAAVGAGLVFFRRHEKELERRAEAALAGIATSSGGKP